jgi:hypothetical protein
MHMARRQDDEPLIIHMARRQDARRISLACMGWEWPGAREREELGHRTSTSMEHQHGVFGGGTHIVLAIRRAGAAHVHT